MQWLSFRQRQLEALYLEHFAETYKVFDATSVVVHVAMTLAWLGRYGRHDLSRFSSSDLSSDQLPNG